MKETILMKIIKEAIIHKEWKREKPNTAKRQRKKQTDHSTCMEINGTRKKNNLSYVVPARLRSKTKKADKQKLARERTSCVCACG